MLHFGSVPCPVLTLTCVFFFVFLKANVQISAWQSVTFHGSAFSACATPAVMHLISTPASHPLQLAYRLFTAPHSLPIMLNLSHSGLLSLCFDSACLRCFYLPLFLTSIFSLMPLLPCLPSAWMRKRNCRTIPALVSVSAGLWFNSIPVANKVFPQRLCQGKPSLPSFNVNMHSRQG